MKLQDVRKSGKQAFNKYKVYDDEKANDFFKFFYSKPKESEYVYVRQTKADHQRIEILTRDFRWLGPYIVQKALQKGQLLGTQGRKG